MPHAEITSAGTDEMLDNGTQDQALNNEASNSIPAINEASHSTLYQLIGEQSVRLVTKKKKH